MDEQSTPREGPLVENEKPRGRYKHLAISTAEMREEAIEVFPRLEILLRMWKAGQLSDGEMAACYVLMFIQKRRRNWLEGRIPPSFRPLSESDRASARSIPISRIPSLALRFDHKQIRNKDISLYEFFMTYRLKSLPVFVNSVLCGWIAGTYALVLDVSDTVPSGYDMLRQQSAGRRIVSMVVQRERMESGYVHEKMDSFEFILHDLAHADRFFRNDEVCNGQVGVFHSLYRGFQPNLGADEDAIFARMISKDKEFDESFEYVCADMNAYAVHLWKCFKALCLNWFMKNELQKTPKEMLDADEKEKWTLFWRQINDTCCPDMDEDCAIASDCVNTSGLTDKMSQRLAKHFENVGERVRKQTRELSS